MTLPEKGTDEGKIMRGTAKGILIVLVAIAGLVVMIVSLISLNNNL